MLKLFGPLVLLIVSASHTAWAGDNSDCWGGKKQIDLKTGGVVFKCIRYSEIPRSFLKTSRLLEIAGMGPAGQKDVSYVIDALKDEDWDVRAEAARTLGLIGYADAAPKLTAAIIPNDWRLTFEAMVSLVKLKAPQAEAVLTSVKNSYWLPSVAEAARNLAEGRTQLVPRVSMVEQFATDFCNAKADPALIPKCSISDDDIERYNAENKTYYRSFWRKFREHPSLREARGAATTLEVQDGKLVGTDYGEWGGELAFLGRKTSQIVIDDNVRAIVRRGDRILAVTGLNHGGLNRGYIWEVFRSDDGRWTARRLWRLPGTPYDIVTAADGTIGLYGPFGSMLFTTDDTLQWLACGPAIDCRRSTK